MKAIEVLNLKKSYGKVLAVDSISFSVEEGTLFAFLGPNGAGKTTTISIICTLLSEDEGEVLLNGYHLGKEDDLIRHDIGIVFQQSVLDDLLTVYENLWTRGKLYGVPSTSLKEAIQDAMKVTGIEEIQSRKYGELSGGQRRRVDIARALIHEPKILFLDEPTTGLDPQTRKNVWQTIHHLQRTKKMTVFLTTHYLEEANDADDVVIIDQGKIVARGTPTELKDQYSSDILILKPLNHDDFMEKYGSSYSFEIQNDLFKLPISETKDAIELLQIMKEDLASFQVLNGTLDDAFIAITGKEMKDL